MLYKDLVVLTMEDIGGGGGEQQQQRQQHQHVNVASGGEGGVRDDRSSSVPWKVCGSGVPKSELVFFSQVVILCVVVCMCLFNLTTGRGDSNLWSALLSGSLRYLLPNPTIKLQR